MFLQDKNSGSHGVLPSKPRVKNHHQLIFLYPAKLLFESEGKKKPFSDEQDLESFPFTYVRIINICTSHKNPQLQY
jgi:hypothetical protein